MHIGVPRTYKFKGAHGDRSRSASRAVAAAAAAEATAAAHHATAAMQCAIDPD